MSLLNYSAAAPSRGELDVQRGPALLEFGANYCGYCRASQGALAEAAAAHPGLRHYRIEDGRGRPLGRSYQVKLWPTLIFLRDGKEVARLVRPLDAAEIAAALARIA